MRHPSQLVATGVTLARLSRGRKRKPALQAAAIPTGVKVSVVIPARNEAKRIAPCLESLDAYEVIVVDDRSTDETAQVARSFGAKVVAGQDPPAGWVGKPWALQQGLEAASGEIVVSLDADTRPKDGLLGALVNALDQADYVSVGAGFDCGSWGEAILHPAMLMTLIYRYGPLDSCSKTKENNLLVNGQCTAVNRKALLDVGGYSQAAGYLTDDVAFARGLATLGWRIDFRDGSELIAVDMHDCVTETWREWGRSFALTDVTSKLRQLVDLLIVWLTLALPPLRILAKRANYLDWLLLTLRALMTFAVAPAYRNRHWTYWLSPLADPLAALRLTISTLRPSRSWRGRTYPANEEK